MVDPGARAVSYTHLDVYKRQILIRGRAFSLWRSKMIEYAHRFSPKLKNWGYYFGEVDGIFGVQTKKAVMDFQRKNGLAVRCV